MRRLETADVKARLRMRAAFDIEPDEEVALAEGLLEDQALMFAGTDISGAGVLALLRQGAEVQELDGEPRAMGLALWCFWLGYELGRSHDDDG